MIYLLRSTVMFGTEIENIGPKPIGVIEKKKFGTAHCNILQIEVHLATEEGWQEDENQCK